MTLRWEKGGDARVLRIDAATIALSSSVPAPPGSRIAGSLVSDPSAVLRVKIHASRRQGDGTFLLEGRPLDLTRAMREKLALLSEKGEP